jgi:hypothetical protein
MANAGFIRELTHERTGCPDCGGSGRDANGFPCATCAGAGTVSLAYRLRSIRRTLLAAVVLTAAGVVLVWLFMFLLAHG